MNKISSAFDKSELSRYYEYVEKVKAILKGFESLLRGEINYVENQKLENDNSYSIAKEFFGDKKPFIVEEIDLNDIRESQQRFIEALTKLAKIKEEFSQVSGIPESHKDFLLEYIDSANEVIKVLSDHAVYLEAEKGGFEFDHQLVVEHQDKVVSMQEKYYGEALSQNDAFKATVLKYVSDMVKNTKKTLNDGQKKQLQEFLNKIQISQEAESALVKQVGDTKKDVFAQFNNAFASFAQENKLSEKDFGQTISPEDMQKIFWYALKYYGFEDWSVELASVGGITVVGEEKKIKVPSEVAEEYSLLRVLRQVNHQVGRVVFSTHNTQTTGFGVEGFNYLPVEEGIAKYMEEYMLGKSSLENPSLMRIKNLLLELYPVDEARELLKLLYSVDSKKYKDALDNNLLRSKRFLAMSLPGVNRKEAAYALGSQELLGLVDSLSEEALFAFIEDSFRSKNSQTKILEMQNLSEDERRSLPNPKLPNNLLGNIMAYFVFKKKVMEKYPELDSEKKKEVEKFLKTFFLERDDDVLVKFRKFKNMEGLSDVQKKTLYDLLSLISESKVG